MGIAESLSRLSGNPICEIPFKLPSLNEYIDVCRRNRYEAANFKAGIEADIAVYLKDLPEFTKPVKIRFHWIEGNRKRDLDNVAFAKKFILDALVKLGKLPDDNRKCVTGFTDSFVYSNQFGCIIEILEE